MNPDGWDSGPLSSILCQGLKGIDDKTSHRLDSSSVSGLQRYSIMLLTTDRQRDRAKHSIYISSNIASVLRRVASSPFGLAANKQPSSDTSEPKTLFFWSNRVILMRLYTTSTLLRQISTKFTNEHYVNITIL